MRLAVVASMIFGIASAAAETPDDTALVAQCAHEVADRFLGAATDHVEIAHQEVARGPAEDRVKVTVATGEGRSATATCKFRGGKLFDVVR
jgi:hypothetical protein